MSLPPCKPAPSQQPPVSKKYLMKTIQICSVFVLNDKNEVLAVRQEYERLNAHHWTLPGGGVDDGETPEIAAIREVMEETGLQVLGTPQKIYDVQCIDKDVTIHVHGFLFRDYDGVPTIHEAEISEIAFLPLDVAKIEMSKMDDESRLAPILKTIEALQAGNDLPCYQCHYLLGDNRSIIECRELSAA